MSKKIADQIIQHPDKDEIISKLICDISVSQISEWLSAKYKGQKELLISSKSLSYFKKTYLDFYSKVRNDTLTASLQIINQTDTMQEVQGSSDYKKKLLEIADKELDIKTIVKNLVIRIDHRAEQTFDYIQNDPRNFKMDKTVIEWMTLLMNTLEKFHLIHDGPQEQNNINIQNNFNINVLDSHMNMLHSVIREILSQLDYESSLLFTELFTKKLQELKMDEQIIIPTEKRLEAAYKIENQIEQKLDN